MRQVVIAVVFLGIQCLNLLFSIFWREKVVCCPVYLQIQYSDMLNRIEPLRNELKTLEVEAGENRRKNDDMMNLIGGLERSIGRYKEEYAVLISQAQAIKADLASVETKVFSVASFALNQS
jgi:hypothetical protein